MFTKEFFVNAVFGSVILVESLGKFYWKVGCGFSPFEKGVFNIKSLCSLFSVFIIP